MRHTRQDAVDTVKRRAAMTPVSWHPILAAVETQPGHWYMVDATNKCYGIVRFLTIDGQSGYRVVTWAEHSDDRRLIGYFTSLRAATVAAHNRYLRSQGRGLPNHDGHSVPSSSGAAGRGA